MKAIPFVAAAATFLLTGGNLVAAQAVFAITSAVTGLLAPKAKTANQERQASVLSLSLGEVSRKMVVGRACVGGSVMVAFNFGGTKKTDWEVLRIALADHPVDALEGFFVGETYYPFTANGLQAGFSNQLDIEFVNGDAAWSTAPPARFVGVPRLQSLTIDSSDRGHSVTQVWAAYKADKPDATTPVWNGRPQFRWVLRGLAPEDPRDATVAWTENAEINRLAYDRGVYAVGHAGEPEHLLVGRGLSDAEIPMTTVIAAVNLCDEDVPLKGGGTEKRWRASGEIGADEAPIDVEEAFAAAMGGALIQPEGGVAVEPGHAKATTFAVTAGGLAGGTTVKFSRELAADKRVTTVIPRYVAPAQGWQDHAAPIRRTGTPRAGEEETLSLRLVTSGTQAQRCGEIRLRLAQLEARGALTLPPPFAHVEAGDWGTVTLGRHTDGQSLTFQVATGDLDAGFRNGLSLSQTAPEVYDWDETVDELTPGAEPAAASLAPFSGAEKAASLGGAKRPLALDPAYPLGGTGRTITVDPATAWLAGGLAVDVPGGTVADAGADDTAYGVFSDIVTGDVEVETFPAAAHLADGRWLLVGWKKTEQSGGGYSPPPAPNPGTGGFDVVLP